MHDFDPDARLCDDCGGLIDRPSKAHAICQDCSGDTPKRKVQKPRKTNKPSKQWPPRRRNARD